MPVAAKNQAAVQQCIRGVPVGEPSSPHWIATDPFAEQVIGAGAGAIRRQGLIRTSDLEDMRQSMRLHLVSQSHHFDPARGRLEAFVTTCASSSLRMELRARGRLKRGSKRRTVSLSAPTLVPGDVSEPLGALVSQADHDRRSGRTGASDLERIDLADEVRFVRSRLTPDERELAELVARLDSAGAAREWSRRQGKAVTARQVARSVARMRRRFLDSHLCEHFRVRRRNGRHR